MRSLAALVALCAAAVAADVLVKNGGTALGPVTTLSCGAGTSCSRSGAIATITASGAGGAGGSGAPVDGGYVVLSGFTSGSTNERTLAAGQYTVIDTGTAGQVQVDWSHGLTCSSGQALTSSGTSALACTSTLTASDVACAGTCVGDAEIASVSGAKVTGAVASATTCSVAESAAYLDLACSAGQYVTCSGLACTCSTPAGGGSANVVEQTVVLSGGAGVFSASVTAAWASATSKIVCGVLGTTDDGLTAETIAVAGLTVTVASRTSGGFTVLVLSPNGLEGTVRVHCTGA